MYILIILSEDQNYPIVKLKILRTKGMGSYI
jgi:hypothetical protein